MSLNTLTSPVFEAAEHDPFEGSALSAFVPISETQSEVWLAAMMDPAANLSYNEGLSLRLSGALDTAALHRALQTIVDRHEALRGVMSPDGRSMMVLSRLALPLPLHDVSATADPDAALMALEAQDMAQEFDLANGPLLRCTLVKLAEDRHHLLFVAHHIVCDGWSSAVVMTELGALYSSMVEGTALQLDEAPRYGDYSLIENRFLRSETGLAHQAYWLHKLEHAPLTLDLPADRPRPAQRTYAASRVDHPLPARLVADLKKVGAAHGASLVATMLAGWATLLHRLTASEDMVIGLSAAGQSLHSQMKLVGHCVNLLPLRLKPRSTVRFGDFLREVGVEVLDAHEHQGVTFGSLLPKLKLARDESRPPLVSVTFNIDVRDDDIRHAGLEVDYHTMVRQTENFEFYINVVYTGTEMVLEACFNSSLFDSVSIRRRLQEFETLLTGICREPSQTIARLPLLTEAERRFLVSECNDTAQALDLSQPLHQHIEAQVLRTPAAVAVIHEQGQLDYAELNRRANQLAHWLRSQGVGPDVCVGICAQRSTELLVALLGTLKAGGAYLPLDPEYPAERLAFMLEDASPAVVLMALPPPEAGSDFGVAARQVMSLVKTPVLDLLQAAAALAEQATSNPEGEQSPDTLAYVTYTSGSTGKPKGAMLAHRGVVNLLLGFQARHALGSSDRILQKTPYSFDPSVWELFWPLMTGAALVLAKPEGHKDPAYLAELIQREGITMTHFVPSMLTTFLDAPEAASALSLRRVFCGGEALTTALAQRFQQVLPAAQLFNMYGPVEATVDVSQWPCQGAHPHKLMPIGRPLANTELHVLDANGELLPLGVAGELYIGGVQLARGYHARPELTAERFIAHPELGRLYRTGDLCRRLPDGAIEFMGRIDFQVKLRGFRVELGEIEATLNRLEGIVESSVNVLERSPGDARLVAWVAHGEADAPVASSLRRALRTQLPEYMVPQAFVPLVSLPLTPSGKLDRRALPSPFVSQQQPIDKIAPRSAAEQQLADIWAELLGTKDIGIDDRFFDLGGHSLLAVQCATRIRQQLGIKVPLRSLLMDPLGVIANLLPDSQKPDTAMAETMIPPRQQAEKSSGWLGKLFGR